MKDKITINPEFMSYAALNPFDRNTHASRKVMFTGNMSQWTIFPNATRRNIKSMMEFAFSQTTFSKKFECDSEIISVIRRFPPGWNSVTDYNPQTLIVFRDVETGVIDCIDVPRHHCLHQKYGFEYCYTEDFYNLRPNQTVPKGTVLATSPAVTPDGDYKMGIEANVYFNPDPATAEDGIRMSDEFAEKITPYAYQTLEIAFGVNDFPLNLYGDFNKDTFKSFPDIGEKVNSDNILFALREYDETLAVINMTKETLKEPDRFYDKKIYCAPNSIVVDVKVTCNTGLMIPPTPVGMEEQLQKYYKADTDFYKQIIDCYCKLRRQYGDRLKLHEHFHRYIVEAYGIVGDDSFNYQPKDWAEKIEQGRVQQLYRGNPIPHWRVQITVMYMAEIHLGNKSTGCHGNKGTNCRITPKKDMPRDEFGNIADLSLDEGAIGRRITPGVQIEQYINGSGRDAVIKIKQAFGLDHTRFLEKGEVYNKLYSLNKSLVEDKYEYLMGWYEAVSPHMYNALREDESFSSKVRHLVEVLANDEILNRIEVAYPVDNPISTTDMLRTLRSKYPVNQSQITYRGFDDQMVTSYHPGMIASIYILVLDKDADGWSGLSSAKYNHYGNTARLTNYDKYSAPGRQQVTKTAGESETRPLNAFVGSKIVFDFLDLHNDPLCHQEAQRNILAAEKPTNIDSVIDRSVFKVGGHRPKNYAMHLFQCSGKTFKRGKRNVPKQD